MPSHPAQELHGRQAFEMWRHTLIHQAMPVEVRSRHIEDFAGSLRTVTVGDLAMLLTSNSPVSVHRPPALIRRSDPETLTLLVNLAAPHGDVHDGTETVLRRGDMTLIHSSLSHRIDVHDDIVWQRGGLVVLEPAALDIAPTDLGRLVGRRLPGDDAVGRLVSRHLTTLASVGGSLRAADADRLASLTADLVAVMLAHHLDALDEVSPQRVERARFARVRSFILARLGDPALTPEVIATANHISLRTLHRMFERHAETTVARWIRDRRLAALRADLMNPRLAAHTVAGLALACGLGDISNATRAFKNAYGLSPGAYRRAQAASQNKRRSRRR